MISLFEYTPTITCIIILIFIMICLYHTGLKAGRSVELVSFTFATAAMLLSLLYWLAFDILYPGQRMPFAANEIAEWAMFLSFASTLKPMLGEFYDNARFQVAGAVIFMISNVILWIAWSGEWLQDIITGLTFGYFVITLVRLMKNTDVLKKRLWIILGIICVLIIASCVATFIVPESLKSLHDKIAYFLLFIAELYFVLRTLICLYRKSDPKVCMSLSAATAAWSIIFMYMSSGGYYTVAYIFLQVSFLFIFLSLRREVER